MDTLDPIPTFYLYGELHGSAAEDFVHVESLEHRSRPADWTIRPHSHRELNHFILIAEGGGVMQAETLEMRFDAPCLLLVPSQVVHGFRWHAESKGFVVTLANSYRDELVRRDGEVGRLFARPAIAALSREGARTVATHCRTLIRELGWHVPGHRTAAETALAAIVVQAMRGLASDDLGEEHRPGRHTELVARFRGLVEERFREREPIDLYASRLGVSSTTLRVACARVAGLAPAQILNTRTFLEAKRALCYSNQSVAEIAYTLGFVDPAYFTRAFTRHAGHSPRRFRAERGSTLDAQTR